MNTKIQDHQVSFANASLSQLYAECKEWQSELSFWEDELQELKQLIFQYAYLGNEDQIVEFKFIGGKVGLDLPDWLNSIRDRLYIHQKMLSLALQRGYDSFSTNLLTEHQAIKQQIDEFRDDCMNTKTELQQLLDCLPVTETGNSRRDRSSF